MDAFAGTVERRNQCINTIKLPTKKSLMSHLSRAVIIRFTVMIWIKKINCAQCGKEITFGEGYTSREIYSGPWGHMVCRECMEHEYERWHLKAVRAEYEDDDTNN